MKASDDQSGVAIPPNGHPAPPAEIVDGETNGERRGPPGHLVKGQLIPAAAAFYASVWKPARAGCLNALRQRGCTETEAEEVFAEVFSSVMGKADPTGRDLPEMVSLLKRACHHRLIDRRRHEAVICEVPLTDAEPIGDRNSEGPAELAERGQAIEVGREAVQTLPRRDQLVFRLRHQLELSPAEVQRRVDGLTPRTYRKIIERANTRVLAAYERIEKGGRCEEMEASLLQRFIAESVDEKESREVRAHLKHCRACQRSCVQMRGYLHDVGSTLAGVLAVTGLGVGSGIGAPISRGLNLLGEWADSVGQATAGIRERGRELAFRLSGALPGGSGEGTIGQVVGLSGAKLTVCAGVAAAGCAAAGFVPGVNGLAQLGGDDNSRQPGPAVVREPASAPNTPTIVPDSSAPIPRENGPARRRKGKQKDPIRQPKARRARPAAVDPDAPPTVSGRQTGSEFGLEAEGVGSSVPEPAPERVAPSAGSGGSPSGGSASGGEGGEFGL